MGDWRRVHIIGTCAAGDVPALRRMLNAPFRDDRWTCLCCGGIVGLPNFAGTMFDAIGNLGERGFDENDVASALGVLRAAAPSLRCIVHCGDEYERDNCVATVVCDEAGIRVREPLVTAIPPQPECVIASNLARLLRCGY